MIINSDKTNIFFTADNHFGHENIIKFTDRPFSSVEEMDKVMIDNWNAMIGPEDMVFHLGDFCLGGKEHAQHYFEQLNGHIHIVYNDFHHDRRWGPHFPYIAKSGYLITLLLPIEVLEVENIKNNGYPQIIVLCHYPLAVWDRRHYGAIHLHGHSHGQYKSDGKLLDVGVDYHDFYPISLSSVLEMMG